MFEINSKDMAIDNYFWFTLYYSIKKIKSSEELFFEYFCSIIGSIDTRIQIFGEN